jgi:ribosomal protein L37AE/L43A
MEYVREKAKRLENIRKMIPCKQCHTMFRRKHGSQIHCSKDCSREYSGGINLEMRKKHLQRIKRLVEGAAESKSRDLQ